MHPFLYRNEAGQVSIRWSKAVALLAAIAAFTLVASLVLGRILGGPIRVVRIVVPIALVLLPQLLVLHLAKRHAEGRSPWQFSLAALLAGLTAASILFALLGWERRADLERYALRGRLEKSILQIEGTANVRVTNTTFIMVQRPSFDDQDLGKLLALLERLDKADSPLTNLVLSGTSVTDRGVGQLKQVESLEYCFLDQTAITDASIDALSNLPNLKVISVHSTAVTLNRLLQLSIDRPELNIEPKTFLKLKPTKNN